MHYPFHANPQVYWNNKKVGTTAHIDDTLDPVWDLEIFAIKVDAEGPNSVELSTLRIECLDWDQVGSDDVLGQIELSGSQIMQLIESGEQDGPMGTAEDDVVGEADMERIFEFIQTFQKHQKEEESLGKMTVGVPQDPNVTTLNSGESVAIAHEDAEVAPVPMKNLAKKKSKRENTRQDVAVKNVGRAEGDEGKEDANIKREEGSNPEKQGSRGSGADGDPGGFKENRQQQTQQGNTGDKFLDETTRAGVKGDVVAGNEQQGEGVGETAGQSPGRNGVLSANGNNVRKDQEPLGLVAIAEEVRDDKREVTTVPGDEDSLSQNRDTKASTDVVDASVRTTEDGDVVTNEAPPNSSGESDQLLKPSPGTEVQLAQTPVPGLPAPVEVLLFDMEKGGGEVEKAPDGRITVDPRDGRTPKSVAGDRDPGEARYRDGEVYCAIGLIDCTHLLLQFPPEICVPLLQHPDVAGKRIHFNRLGQLLHVFIVHRQ